MSDWSFWTSYFPDSQPKAQDVEGQGLACWMISCERVQSYELRARMWDIKCKVRIRPRAAAGATRRWWVWGKLAPWRKRVDIIHRGTWSIEEQPDQPDQHRHPSKMTSKADFVTLNLPSLGEEKPGKSHSCWRQWKQLSRFQIYFNKYQISTNIKYQQILNISQISLKVSKIFNNKKFRQN